MNIAEALKRGTDALNENSQVIYLNGSVTKDPQEGFFRLFPEPGNYRSYFVLNAQDVAGDIYEWSTEERVRANLIGTSMLRVPIRLGTTIQSVEINLEKVGETIEGGTSLRPRAGGGGCRHSSGCGSTPCCNESGTKCYCSYCCVA